MDRIITSSRDRSSLLSTHKVLRNTYFLLSLTLAFSAITATASTVLMLPSPGLILTLVGMYGLMFLTYKTANKPTGIISAFAFTGFLGYILGPMLNAYLSAGMGDLIGLALGGTALVFFCCSEISFCLSVMSAYAAFSSSIFSLIDLTFSTMAASFSIRNFSSSET